MSAGPAILHGNSWPHAAREEDEATFSLEVVDPLGGPLVVADVIEVTASMSPEYVVDADGNERPEWTVRVARPSSGRGHRRPAPSWCSRSARTRRRSTFSSSHAVHFLQRLDRVLDHEVELALTLHRDEELLRGVLQGVSIPDGAGRVAISLDDPHLGPFVVVMRSGKFVTCLARSADHLA